ncbi:substrate-binding domain-containing protein [Clostridium sp. MCC353]|uniref:LacI family DNA-binding transcriptional regulator n=1 Tax=Clostridium sp. MCC353 TaxID=2592646 RepID=UPI001C00CC45|nr:LacI family DNA-binding transcriptional regulator [Clostridium sp. MCC353]MBT9778035.1 substrate-binding domain-containing protein [Clostridium sp. MCC353]
MKNGKPTIKEIAEKTGVSIGTVHRAIYGKEGVGEETRKRILAEVEKMNFQIDAAASSLKRKTINIAVVLPQPKGEDQYYFRGIWEGIKEAAEEVQKYKINFIYIESEYRMDKLSMELQKLYDTMLDDINGLITLSDTNDSNEWIARFYKQGVTIVLISSYGRIENYFCSIKVDHVKAGRLAAEFLSAALPADQGKILLLSGNADLFSNRNYANGFLEDIKRRGIENEMIVLDGFGKEDVEERCRILLDTEDISAIFCCNARNTYILCQLLEQRQKKRPLFIGTDVFFELKPYFENGILTASIYQSNKEQGRMAVEVLYRYLTTGSRSRSQEFVPIGLVMKSNCEYYIN